MLSAPWDVSLNARRKDQDHPSAARPNTPIVLAIQELPRFARGEGFDEEPMPGLYSEALDFRAASELFTPHRKLARRDLESLRLDETDQAILDNRAFVKGCSTSEIGTGPQDPRRRYFLAERGPA